MLNTGGPISSLVRHGRFYLRHHTPRKFSNLALTSAALLGRPIHAPNLPITLKVEPSAACQLACPGCLQSDPGFKAKTQGKTMSMEIFNSILRQAGDYLYRIQFYYNGEPFINKHLLEMIVAATARGIGSQVSTNFSFHFKDDFYRDIVESGLEHIIISLDGTDADTYSRYRVNGRYELVEHGMRQVIRWKRVKRRRFPIVEWQFIIFNHNRHQLEAAKRLAEEIGVDRLCLKYDGYSDPATWNQKDQRADRWSRRIKLNSCLWLWGGLVVGWNGLVNPCCSGGAYTVTIGDLAVTPIREIWNSGKIKELRAFVRRSPLERTAPDQASHPCYGCRFIM